MRFVRKTRMVQTKTFPKTKSLKKKKKAHNQTLCVYLAEGIETIT